jgi:hypothetical protein
LLLGISKVLQEDEILWNSLSGTLRDAGTDPGNPEATGGEVSFLRAQMANEVLKAQTAKVRLEKLKAEVIGRALAKAMVFDLARRERDAWLNFGWRRTLRSAIYGGACRPWRSSQGFPD